MVLHRQRSRRRLASEGGGGSESGGSDSGHSGSSGSSSSGAESESSDSSAPGTHTPHASTSDDEEEAASAPSIVIGHEVPRELGEVIVRRKARVSERARSSGSSSCSVGASSEGSEGGEAGNATTPTGHAGADVRDDGGEDGHETACDDDQAETEEAKNKAPRKASQRGIELYFKVWTTFAVVAAVLNGLNVKWTHLSAWSIPLAVILFIVQCALQWSACEIPLISFATLLVTPPEDEKADGSKLTVAINYNLLASDKLEVEACLGNAYEAYIGNLAPTVSSILVSATGDPDLKN